MKPGRWWPSWFLFCVPWVLLWKHLSRIWTPCIPASAPFPEQTEPRCPFSQRHCVVCACSPTLHAMSGIPRSVQSSSRGEMYPKGEVYDLSTWLCGTLRTSGIISGNFSIIAAQNSCSGLWEAQVALPYSKQQVWNAGAHRCACFLGRRNPGGGTP